MWKQAAGVGAGVAAGLVLGAAIWAKASPPQQAAPEVIRAQRFDVVDKEGIALASFGVREAGDIGKRFGIEGRFTMLALSTVSNKNKEVQGFIGLVAAPSGVQMVALVNPKEKTGVFLMLPPEGNPSVVLFGKDGKARTIKP